MYQNYIFDLYGTLIDIHTDEYSKNFLRSTQNGSEDRAFILSGSAFINCIPRQRGITDRKRLAADTQSPRFTLRRCFAMYLP